MQTQPDDTRPQASDEDLVRKTRAGATDAFDALVRRYRGIVIGRAYALLHDRAEAEDVAQEAFLAAFRSLGQLRRPDAFGAWLLTVTANLARRAASKRARRPVALLGDHATRDRPPNAELFDAVAALPEGHQQVIHLHYAHGYTCAEIAQLLGLRVGSVTSRLTRARQRLRLMLDEDDR